MHGSFWIMLTSNFNMLHASLCSELLWAWAHALSGWTRVRDIYESDKPRGHNHCWATTCTNLSLININIYIYIYFFDIHNYTHVIAKTTINVWRIQLQFGKLARIGRFCADSVGMCLDQCNVGAIALPHVDNNLMWCTWQNWCWFMW